MSAGQSILAHPDREEIDAMLLRGESLSAVEKFLKQKYPRSKRQQRDKMTLSSYRKNYLQAKMAKLEQKDTLSAKRTTADVSEANIDTFEESEVEEAKELSVQAKSDDLEMFSEGRAKDVIDTRQEVLGIRDRLLDYITKLEAQAGGARDYEVLGKLINQLRGLIIDWERLFGHLEETTAITISIGEAEEAVARIKRAIRVVLLEMEPSLVPVFFAKLEAQLAQDHDSEEHRLREVRVSIDKAKQTLEPAYYEEDP